MNMNMITKTKREDVIVLALCPGFGDPVNVFRRPYLACAKGVVGEGKREEV